MMAGGVTVTIAGLPPGSPLVLGLQAAIQVELAQRVREQLPGDGPWEQEHLEAAAVVTGLPSALAEAVLAVEDGSMPLPVHTWGETEPAATEALALRLLDGDLQPFSDRLLPSVLRRLLRLHRERGQDLSDHRSGAELLTGPLLQELRRRLEARDPVVEPDFVRDGMIALRRILRPLVARVWLEQPERLGRSLTDALESTLLVDIARAPAERREAVIAALRDARARGRGELLLRNLARRLLAPEPASVTDDPFLERLAAEVIERNREASRRGSPWRVCVVHVDMLATLRALAASVAVPSDEGKSAAEGAWFSAEGALDSPPYSSIEAELPGGRRPQVDLGPGLRALKAVMPAPTWAVLWAAQPP
jgi:hypothetical protein